MTSAAADPPIDARVLEFYRTLPFNVAATPAALAARIRAANALEAYPPLLQLVGPGRRTLDLGCGAGWLSNTMALHQRATVTGVDFNPVAIEFARTAARELGTGASFVCSDLFDYTSSMPFDIVVSIGVLHHTKDCQAAVRRAAALVRPRGFLFVGLYHAHGRRPFLDHFAQLARDGCDEDARYRRFAALFGDQSLDETHLRSWFRDQVLHPHETQHTLGEMLPILDSCGMMLMGASFDDYARPVDLPRLLAMEADLERIGRERLAAGRYYPGFFCFLAQRRA
jgi:SAM-dependent methyltransferase